MPSGPKALSFKKPLISLLISFIKIIGLILSALYSVITFVLILLKSTILVLRKNLAAKISAFKILLFIKGSLINLLKSNKWESAFAMLAFLLHFNKI